MLASPDARENPEVTKAVLSTIMYKIDLWRNMDPALIDALGGRPAPPPYPMNQNPQQEQASGADQLKSGPPEMGQLSQQGSVTADTQQAADQGIGPVKQPSPTDSSFCE